MFCFDGSSQRAAAALKQFDNFLYFFLFALAFTIATGYNLDSRNAKIFRDPQILSNSRGSYFGFSTALYVNVNRREDDSTIIVGAPRANSSNSLNEPGAVYKCKINEEECKEWNIDPTGNGPVMVNGTKFNQMKNNSWIGASIRVDNDGKSQPTAVVCAPRWINMEKWLMNGICYYSSIAPDGETFEKQATERLVPLGLPLKMQSQVDKKGHSSWLYGYSETGFSLHLHPNDNHSVIMLGSPGVNEWQGIPLLCGVSNSYRMTKPPKNTGSAGMPVRGHEYFGYSVSSGFYFGDRERWYAAGAPRGGSEKTGAVLIFRFSFLPWESQMLVGENLGDYFGASLASCDVNNDGSDDIVVGAPFWTKNMDEGRVYVYTKNPENKFVRLVTITGRSDGARFGSVVTCLGDLDNDGYGDIAVGAPYESDHGAIYIYYGNRKGLDTENSQRIAGESIYKDIKGFGGAISEARDVDGNGYVDIAVGAYLSGQVVLLRSRPVITLQLNVTTNPEQLLQNSSGFVVTVCLSYKGLSAPPQIDFVITLKMDNFKAFVHDNKNEIGTYQTSYIAYHNGTNNCPQFPVDLEKGEKNFVEPIKVDVSAHLKNSCAKCPVINKSSSKVEHSITLPFATACGDDNVCNSKLRISSLVSDGHENAINYTLGSNRIVYLSVEALNDGEPAYNAHAHIFIPEFISLYSLPHECKDSRIEHFREITCELEDPFTGFINLPLGLNMNDVRSYIDPLEILANISTSSKNDKSMISSRNLTINFVVDADLAISGSKVQNVSYLNKEQKILESITFQHIYEVNKLGPSPIKEFVLTVSVPTHWKAKSKPSIEIATVNETLVVMAGKTFDCTISSRINDTQIVNEAEISNDSLILENEVFEGLTTEDDLEIKLPAGSRTLYLNCSNHAIKCSEITCKLGNFEDSRSTAILTITLDLHLRNLRPETMEAKDIFFFVSNGSVSITQPIVKNIENEHVRKLVGTRFVGLPIVTGVATWIIAVSVLLGIALLILLTLGLFKLGFFQRKKREELDALKAKSTNTQGFVLETTSGDVLETSSSGEVLETD